MTTSQARTLLETRGIQAQPEQLNHYLLEAVEQLETVLLLPAREQLSTSELQVLREGGFDIESTGPIEDDPLGRTIAEYASLVETAISTRKAAHVLKRDESRIRQRLAERTLYGIRQGRSWVLPLFQFTVRQRNHHIEPHQEVPGLVHVLPCLNPELDAVSVYRWFTTASDELYDAKHDCALSPRDWLLAGYPVEPVARFAEDV